MTRLIAHVLAIGAFLATGLCQRCEAGELPEWLETMKLGGDLRLRHDTQWRTEKKTGGEEVDYARNRERFRLRLNLQAKPTESTSVGVRLASGSGFQNTTNQSFDGHGRGKDLFIDLAYATWKASDVLTIMGGKHKNPLMTSPLVWDPDVNIEGVSESFTFDVGERSKLFATLGQWIIEEINVKDTDSDPTLLAYQLGAHARPGDNMELEIGTTFYDFVNLDVLSWSDGTLGDGTDFLGYSQGHSQQMIFDADGRLLNEFGCWEMQGNLALEGMAQPLSVFGGFVQNLDADIAKLVSDGVDPGDSDPADLGVYGDDDRDSGWMVGFSVGKKKPGDWYAKYFYQELEDYAFPASFVDSDFHGGGTNNKGHLIQGSYQLAKNVQAKATGFFTERQDERKDGQKDENRIQLDVVFKF